MPPFIDLTGKTFEYLTVVERGPTKGVHIYWFCDCRCGTKRKLINGDHLRRGNTRSCGCLAEAMAGDAARIHGMSHTIAEYNVWAGMRQRCLNPNAPSYQNYGGRGITVCERWESFPLFYQDMGPRPTPKHSLERLDNEQGYRPENCAWKTAKEQTRNTRHNRRITIEGRTACLAEWLESVGILLSTFKERERRGWDAERALMTPVDMHKSLEAKNRPRTHLITIHGQTATLTEWLTIFELGPQTFYQRVKRGWSEEKALVTPVNIQHRRHI